MSVEQRFHAAVNVIRGLPKNGKQPVENVLIEFTQLVQRSTQMATNEKCADYNDSLALAFSRFSLTLRNEPSTRNIQIWDKSSHGKRDVKSYIIKEKPEKCQRRERSQLILAHQKPVYITELSLSLLFSQHFLRTICWFTRSCWFQLRTSGIKLYRFLQTRLVI